MTFLRRGRAPRPAAVARLAGVLALTALACGGCSPTPGTEPPPGPNAGSITLSMQTVGLGPDLDGYTARLDQGATRTLPRDGTITFANVPAGAHTMQIGGVAKNCTLAQPDSVVTVEDGKVTAVQAVVTCRVDLHGRLVAVSYQSAVGQLVAMRPDGTDRIALTADAYDYEVPALFPDGSRMVYTRRSGGVQHLFVFDIASATSIQLPELGTRSDQAAVSPDGTRLAVAVMTEHRVGERNFRIWSMGVDGSKPMELTVGRPSESQDLEPTWSPDGQAIVFNRNGTLMRMHADGTGLTPLPCPAAPCRQPAWSPDGQMLAFTGLSDDDGDGIGENSDIYIMLVDGTGGRRLTTSPDPEDSPAWSQDGTMLAYHRAIDNLSQVFRMMADGSAQVNVTNALHHEAAPVWGPTR